MEVHSIVTKGVTPEQAMAKLKLDVYDFFAYRIDKNTICVSHNLLSNQTSDGLYIASALICYNDAENQN